MKDLKWTENAIFSKLIKYSRFRSILSLIHCECSDDDNSDVLRKIRHVVDHLVAKFQATYRPGENISIEESLLLWKSRLKFKQFNRNKRARFGLKLYETYDSNNGYAHSIQIYAGKDRDDTYIDKRIGISDKIVKKLIGNLHGQGRTLFIDNGYYSPNLFCQLNNEKTNETVFHCMK